MPKVMFDNINLNIRKQKALDDIVLHLEGDEIIGVIGNRYAGKNYLLPLIPSYRYPSNGHLTVDGENAFENSDVMTKVVYTWPTEKLHNSRSIMNGFKFCERLRPNWDMDFAMNLLESFNLTPKLKIRKLNDQQLSTFNCICGLAARAPITIFDGTHLRLNEEQRNLFYKILREDHKSNPRMIIISSGDATEIESFIDDAVLLDKGQVIAHETVNVITKEAGKIMKLDRTPLLQEVFEHFTDVGGDTGE